MSDGQPLPEGTVTVLFTDLVGSTELNQELGDEASGAVEREIEHHALELVAKHRGSVVKDTGDGLMAAFQSARRAVTCAQEIQRAMARRNRERPGGAVRMRIGLHTGEVVAENGDLFGETVIVAKRIEGLAPPGAIFASDTVYGVLGTARAELQDRGEFELKGIAVPWQLYEVPWTDEGETAVLASNRPTPFVRREAELARLKELVERTRRGSGTLVLISGEAGVGKSRLAEEAAKEAERAGLGPLVGHCLDMESAQPYLPLIEQIEQAARAVSAEEFRDALGENAPEVAKLMPELRQRFSDIPEPVSLPPEQERRYLLHGVTEFIERAAHARPLLLTFEDLHWADDATLLLLRQLAQRLDEMPVLVIGTYRQTELSLGRPFGAVLEDLLRERLADEIVLDQLAEDGVAALLEGRAGRRPPPELVTLVYSETEGNPFFVEEVFRHLAEAGKLFEDDGSWKSGIHIADTEVPRGLRLVIGRRLERVSEDCRRVLTTAAVVGRSFGFDLLLRIGRFDEDQLLDALEEAEGATLVLDASVEREARYAFGHEQIRQTLLSALSFPRRQRLHLRIADTLEDLHGDSVEYAGDLAHHLYQAGAAADPERTARFLLLAGQRAMAALGFEDALRQFEAALTVLPDRDPEARARVLHQRALALRGAARIDEALATFAEALAGLPDGEVRNEILYERARLQIDLFRGREAVRDLEGLLESARASGDRARELELLLALGKAHYVLSLDDSTYGQPARDSYEQAYALARELDDRQSMALALIPTTAFVDYWRDYRSQARANVEEATTLAEELGDEELALDCATARLKLHFFNPAEITAEAESVRDRLKARRDPIRLKEHYFWMMWHYQMRADFERCVETCDAGLELSEELGSDPVQYPTIKALALLELGRFDEAWRSLEGEVADEDHRFGRAFQQLGEAVYLSRVGDLERAASTAKEALGEFGELSRPHFQTEMISLLSTLAARMGTAGDELRSWAAEASTKIEREPSPLATAELALADGTPERALELVMKVADGAKRGGIRQAYIQALEIQLRALLALRRWPEAAALANEAIAEAEQTGCRSLAWRMLAARACARREAGDGAEADGDISAARKILNSIADSISDPEQRALFLADTAASELLP